MHQIYSILARPARMELNVPKLKKCIRAYCSYTYCELSSLLQTAVDLTSLGTMHMEQWKGEAYQVGLKRIPTILKLHAEHKIFYSSPNRQNWPKQSQVLRDMTRTLIPKKSM